VHLLDKKNLIVIKMHGGTTIKMLTESSLWSPNNCTVNCIKHCCDSRSCIFTCKCSETAAMSPVWRQKLVLLMINFTLCSPPKTVILSPLLHVMRFDFLAVTFFATIPTGLVRLYVANCQSKPHLLSRFLFSATCTFRCSVDFPLVVVINTCL
jgi:hypothetical protein